MTYATTLQEANQVLSILQTLETRIRGIRIEMVGRAEEPDGIYYQTESAPPVTFQMEIDRYLGQIARIEEEWSDDLDLIKSLRDTQEKKEKASLEGAAA